MDYLERKKTHSRSIGVVAVRIIHNWLMKNSTKPACIKLPFHLVQIQIRTDPLNEAKLESVEHKLLIYRSRYIFH